MGNEACGGTYSIIFKDRSHYEACLENLVVITEP